MVVIRIVKSFAFHSEMSSKFFVICTITKVIEIHREFEYFSTFSHFNNLNISIQITSFGIFDSMTSKTLFGFLVILFINNTFFL